MTKPTSVYLPWIDEQIAGCDDSMSRDMPDEVREGFLSRKASLLANRAGLVRHDDDGTGHCPVCYGIWMNGTPVPLRWQFPCPSRNDITEQLDKVMGVEG